MLIVLASGVALRLFHYIYNRSLWTDELYLCSGLLHLNYTELASGLLDHQQKAPIGFLWPVKMVMDVFGRNEMALRLIPLIAGMVSLFLFSKLSRSFLSYRGAIVATALFALSPALVYHSTEIKQYAMECLGTVLALYFYLKFRDRAALKDKIYWGLLGAVIIWFSFSSIFILMGTAAALSLHSILRKDWKTFVLDLLPFSIWVLSFAVNFLLFTHKHAESEWIVYWFKTYNNFMPLPPRSLKEWSWFPVNFLQLMDYPLGVSWNFNAAPKPLALKILCIPFIPIILLFTGFYAFFKTDRRSFLAFIFAVLLTLLASGLYLYPLLERFWVFIAPVFILCMAAGFDDVCTRVRPTAIQAILALVLLSAPLYQSAYFIFNPQKFYKHKKSYEREAMVYVNDHFQKDDAVYNYWNNEPAYTVYKQIKTFKYQAVQGQDFRKSSADLDAYNRNLQQDFHQFLNHKRVWVIYQTQVTLDVGDRIDDPLWYYKGKQSPENNLITEMGKIGKLKEKIVYSDVTVCLFII